MFSIFLSQQFQKKTLFPSEIIHTPGLYPDCSEFAVATSARTIMTEEKEDDGNGVI